MLADRLSLRIFELSPVVRFSFTLTRSEDCIPTNIVRCDVSHPVVNTVLQLVQMPCFRKNKKFLHFVTKHCITKKI